jgi:hypothetical protein
MYQNLLVQGEEEETQLSQGKILQALAFYTILGHNARAGFNAALSNCGCRLCLEIIRRIQEKEFTLFKLRKKS